VAAQALQSHPFLLPGGFFLSELCEQFVQATANPTEVVLTETEPGRANLCVVNSLSPKGEIQ